MNTGKIIPRGALFPSDLRLNIESHDACEMETQSVFWPVEHKQFARGKFRGEILAIHTGQLQLSLTNHSVGVSIRGGIPAGTAILALPCSPQHSIYYRGNTLGSSQIIALTSGEELEFHTSRPSSLLTVAINADLLEKYCIFVSGLPFKELTNKERLMINPHRYEQLIARLAALLERLYGSRHIMDAQEERLIEQHVLETILLGGIPTGVTPKMPGRLYSAAKAERYIRKNLKKTISIRKLCHVSGTSERALRQGFQDRFGVSPKRYMQIMRLNGVYAELRRGTAGKNVSDTAMEWKFYHLGRFSQQYKQMFGELPGTTKKRTC